MQADPKNRNHNTHAGWINELLLLAEHPNPIPGFARRAMKIIAEGVAETGIQAPAIDGTIDLAGLIKKHSIQAHGHGTGTDVLKFAEELQGLLTAHNSAAAFTQGAKAVFDALQMRAANHWHGNPEVDKVCQRENKLVLEWAEEALEEVSPESVAKWRSLTDMFEQGRQAGLRQAVER